jgi:nucleotide-binding universal stress UspA family protein
MKTMTPIKETPRPRAMSSAALQIKTILVPLDFSHASMHALKYTIALAEEFKAAIHLVHVQPADEFTALSNAGHLVMNCADAIALMQDRLAEVQEKHDVKFWPDNCHVVSGKPYEEIVKLARELHIDLIVLPTRGHSGLKRIALGSTAERVVRFAGCPVLIPRGAKFNALTWSTERAGKFSPRQILVPVDFSDCSLAGLKYAALLAKRFNAKLRLFHAIYPYNEMFQRDRAGHTPPLIEIARAHAKEEIDRMRRFDFMHGISCETEIRVGTVVDEICESGEANADLIVTSTHGRTGFKHAMLGSVSEHVVRYAECPVLVVPSRGQFHDETRYNSTG